LTKISNKQIFIDDFNDKILLLEKEINNQQNQIEAKYAELQKQIKNIYDEFNAKIISGRIFTDVILDSVSSAYKSGYIEHLPEYYSTEEVANRVKEIEQIITNK
jgi:malate synthase